MKSDLERLKEEIRIKEFKLNELKYKYSKISYEFYKNTLKIIIDEEKDLREQLFNQIRNYNLENKKMPDRLIIPIEQKSFIVHTLSNGIIIDFTKCVEKINGIEIEWC